MTFQYFSENLPEELLTRSFKPKYGWRYILYRTPINVIFVFIYLFYFSCGPGEGDDDESVFAEAGAARGGRGWRPPLHVPDLRQGVRQGAAPPAAHQATTHYEQIQVQRMWQRIHGKLPFGGTHQNGAPRPGISVSLRNMWESLSGEE